MRSPLLPQRSFAFVLLCVLPCTCGGGAEKQSPAACVPILSELCIPPLNIWVEGNELLRQVQGTGACSFDSGESSSGFASVGGTFSGSGICHIVSVSTSGATEEQDITVGPLSPDPNCGCQNYPIAGPISVLAFSQRTPATSADGKCICPADRYCASGAGPCVQDAATSECLLRPTSCNSTSDQSVCGCDGRIYANPCVAQMAGTAVGPANACVLPVDQFACVGVICTNSTQNCRILSNQERNYESGSCEDNLSCMKAFSTTCGCAGLNDCTCEMASTGAVTCRIKVTI